VTNMLTHCPACKAKYTGIPLCRRCGLDLVALISVLQQADAHTQKALQAFLEHDFVRMLTHARRTLSLRRTPNALQLTACAALLNQDFRGALGLWRQTVRKL